MTSVTSVNLTEKKVNCQFRFLVKSKNCLSIPPRFYRSLRFCYISLSKFIVKSMSKKFLLFYKRPLAIIIVLYKVVKTTYMNSLPISLTNRINSSKTLSRTDVPLNQRKHSITSFCPRSLLFNVCDEKNPVSPI